MSLPIYVDTSLLRHELHCSAICQLTWIYLSNPFFQNYIILEEGDLRSLIDQSIMLVLVSNFLIGHFWFDVDKISILSELLLTYVGVGGDMADQLGMLELKVVAANLNYVYLVLFVWSISLLQFIIPKTGIISSRDSPDQPDSHNNSVKTSRCIRFYEKRVKMLSNETTGMVTTLLLQDIPFLISCINVMVVTKFISYNMVFFCVKNAAVIVLQMIKVSTSYITQCQTPVE